MKEINHLCADIEQNSLKIGNEIYYAENSHLTKTVILGLLSEHRVIVKADNKDGFRSIDSCRALSIDHFVTTDTKDKQEEL